MIVVNDRPDAVIPDAACSLARLRELLGDLFAD
jgi:hypothetical protein